MTVVGAQTDSRKTPSTRVRQHTSSGLHDLRVGHGAGGQKVSDSPQPHTSGIVGTGKPTFETPRSDVPEGLGNSPVTLDQ